MQVGSFKDSPYIHEYVPAFTWTGAANMNPDPITGTKIASRESLLARKLDFTMLIEMGVFIGVIAPMHSPSLDYVDHSMSWLNSSCDFAHT